MLCMIGGFINKLDIWEYGNMGILGICGVIEKNAWKKLGQLGIYVFMYIGGNYLSGGISFLIISGVIVMIIAIVIKTRTNGHNKNAINDGIKKASGSRLINS